MDWARFARATDAMVVALLAVWGQATVWTAGAGAVADDRPVHALLVAVATVPLFVRRYRPLLALLLVLGAGWLHDELGGTSGVLWFGLCLALYALGAHADRRSVVAGSALVAVGILAVDVPRLLDGAAIDDVLPAWVILTALVGLGRWMRNRHRETRALEARATLTEQGVAEQAARAVADERARIARELHDLVAHSMGVIVIQSQAAQRALESRPDLARTALSSIETAGRQGMAEMRRLLGLLTGAGADTVAPQPSLQELGELADRIRRAGVPVRLAVTGDLASLPAGVDLAAYRIVQEALTNVLKHAGPAIAHVAVRAECGEVVVEVCDDGKGSGAAGAGHGLVGMRERVALYGGSVEAGSLPGGGWRVRARLAVDGDAGVTIRVLIVDDEELVRTGLRLILEAEPDLTVVGSASDGASGIAAVLRFGPDVVLMDIRMPGLDGLAATRQLLGGPDPSPCKVVILTTFGVDEHVYEALRAGASGFLLKDVPADQLAHAIRVAAAGEALLAPSVTRRLIAAFARQAAPGHPAVRPAGLADLTPREVEVLALLAEGLSNAEIAERLFVGEATVKTHVARILTKLAVRDRVQAVIVAFRAGLVPTDR